MPEANPTKLQVEFIQICPNWRNSKFKVYVCNSKFEQLVRVYIKASSKQLVFKTMVKYLIVNSWHDRRDINFEPCSLFKPVPTINGICQSYNALPTNQVSISLIIFLTMY